MAKREPKKTLCHDCLEPFLDNLLYHSPMQRENGPEYNSGLCESCAKKRGHNIKKLETLKEFHKRMNNYLGLK